MAGRFPDEWLDELRSRADLVSIVSEQVALRRSGRRFVGLCPFHQEKTASFHVDPELGLYHCFGCNAGGNVIGYVMAMERMEFNEAVRYLAEKVRMPVPEGEQSQESHSVREAIYEINRKAAHFFHETLYTKDSAETLLYLHRRGLDDPVIRAFGIGAAPNGWDTLTQKFLKDAVSAEILTQAGLSVEKNGKIFDMFRNRVIFPIINAHGAVLGFGGRAIGDAQPKYLNTPDTPAFNKRFNIYAANLLRKERKLTRVLLVEGYMDVVMLFKHGVKGVAATLGTALTNEQAKLLKRYAPEITIAYDGDAAGQKATLRALDIFDSLEIVAKVLLFPDGMDPDEFIREKGREAFEALPSFSSAQYRMKRAAEGFDLSVEEDRTQYAIACASIVKAVKHPVEQENLLKRLMVETGYSREVLVQQIGIAPLQKSVAPKPNPRIISKNSISNTQMAEKTLLSLMIGGLVPEDLVEAERFSDPKNRQIAEWLLQGKKVASLLDESDDQELHQAVLTIMHHEPLLYGDEAMDVVTECLERMRQETLQNRFTMLNERLQQAAGDERNAILMEITRLNIEMNRLRPGRKE